MPLPASFPEDARGPGPHAVLGERQVSYAEIRQEAASIAAALKDAGLEYGERIAVATSSPSSFFTLFAACWSGGYTISVIDPLAGAGEFRKMLTKTAPAALIADAKLIAERAEDRVTNFPRRVWHTGAPASAEAAGLVGEYPTIDELAEKSSTPSCSRQQIPHDLPAYIVFTSGSTSDPKAVVVSRSALRRHVATLASVFGYDQQARLLHFLPTHHTDGLVHGVAAPLFTGMTVVNPGKFVQTVDLRSLLREHRISHLLTVPTMLALIRHAFSGSPDLFDYDGFQNLISTAGYLDREFWNEFQSFFGIRIANFYGMTETVSGSLYCGPDDASFRIGTVGRPVDAEVRIVDENGAYLDIGEAGELQIKGDHLMDGYLDDPEATREAIVDGWLGTGDLFTQDADGYFKIVGRKKNIVKRGGITIYPEDIRKVIAAMPGILEVEVIGIRDPTFEEILCVAAVAEDGIEPEHIRSLCRKELAPERRPDRIELLEQLPRGPSGKVRQDALLAELGQRRTTSGPGEMPLRDQVFSIAADVFATEPTELRDTSSPETVPNWDSYAGMEFVLALERAFDLRFSTRDIMSIRSLGQALQIVSRTRLGSDDGKS